MAWTYDPSKLETDLMMQVRLRIGDTDADDQLLQDEELRFFLKETGDNVLDASIRAVSSIIAILASQVDFRIGPYAESSGDRLSRFKALFDQLSSQNPGMTLLMRPPTTPPIFRYDFLSDTSQIDPIDEIGGTI